MKDTKLKLKVLRKGTHILPMSEWNNDVPSPCECVADALADLEYLIGELVKVGGAMQNPAAWNNAKNALSGLNLALNEATKQNWVLTLEGDPVEHTMPEAPVENCNCYTCECRRAAKQ